MPERVTFPTLPPGVFARAVLCVLLAAPSHGTAQSVSDAVQTFYTAADARDRRDAADALRESGLSALELVTALETGPTHGADVATGLIEETHSVDGQAFPYLLLVPEDYTPTRRYPVRFFLHGGVARPEWDRGGQWWRRHESVASADYISVMPAAWDEHPWWRGTQVESLTAILDRIKRDYAVDENRVSLTGISDGGTGVYFVATRNVTPWASFLPFIAHPAVLFNPRVGAEGETYPINLRNRPWFIVNGENDRLYPTASMEPFIAEFSALGIDLRYRPIPGGGHDVNWWPTESERIDAFIDAQVRNPLPDSIWWETDDPTAFGRAHWVVIRELGTVPGQTTFGRSLLFPSARPSGRIEARREGNEVHVQTEGVARFDLLLSPRSFDLTAPITVYVNRSVTVRQLVEPDVDTVLEWALRDMDRTALYAAHLSIRVPPA